jgi:hypothetical protein
MIQSPSDTDLISAFASEKTNSLMTCSPVLATSSAKEVKPMPDIELLSVQYDYDGGFIMVQYRAAPSVAQRIASDQVYVIDENTGTVYNDIPVAPLIGPLLGRPKQDGQTGYAMFVNFDYGIRAGSTVTVVLDGFRQEHVVVQ